MSSITGTTAGTITFVSCLGVSVIAGIVGKVTTVALVLLTAQIVWVAAFALAAIAGYHLYKAMTTEEMTGTQFLKNFISTPGLIYSGIKTVINGLLPKKKTMSETTNQFFGDAGSNVDKNGLMKGGQGLQPTDMSGSSTVDLPGN